MRLILPPFFSNTLTPGHAPSHLSPGLLQKPISLANLPSSSLTNVNFQPRFFAASASTFTGLGAATANAAFFSMKYVWPE